MTREVPKPDLLEALQRFDSPTVSNAIEQFKIRNRTEGYASMELRCWFPDLSPMVGYAVTCTADSTSPEPMGPDRLPDFMEAVATSPQPAVVVIQTKGPDLARSCVVGDMVCTSYHRLGAVGLVTNGGIRDVKGIAERAPGFRLFTLGNVASHGTSTILEIGVPVRIAGLTIVPGDLLHGDASGLIKVPLDIAEQLVEQARAVQEKERQFFEFLNSDAFSLEALKSRIRRYKEEMGYYQRRSS